MNSCTVTDKQADSAVWVALALWMVSCVYGPLAIPFQCFLILWIIFKCDIKLIPALMILHFTKANLPILPGSVIQLKIGFLLSPGLVFQFGCFFFVLCSLARGRYDTCTARGVWLWLPALIPGLWMSLGARFNGVTAIWSGPLMDSLVPAGYFWAILLGRSWDAGKGYFYKRMVCLLTTMMILMAGRVFYVWTFSLAPAVICLFIIACKHRFSAGTIIYTGVGSLAALFYLAFSRFFSMAEETGYSDNAEIGSTFTQVGVTFVAIMLSLALASGFIRRATMKVLPYLFLAFTTTVVLYAVQTTSSRGYVEHDYRSLSERFRMKLFNDRATVWQLGLDETFSSPYFIKDIRAFVVDNAVVGKTKNGALMRGTGLKVPPHNQVLTLLGRDGWWLGLTLVLWLWWIHIRAIDKATLYGDDPVFLIYFLPVSFSLFHILGLTGQSTCSMAIINHGFEATLVCGVIYGAVYARQCEQRAYRWVR